MAKKKSRKAKNDKIMKELHKLGDELSGLIKTARKRYEGADEKTKKKVVAGIAGAAALIAGAIGYSKTRKKK